MKVVFACLAGLFALGTTTTFAACSGSDNTPPPPANDGGHDAESDAEAAAPVEAAPDLDQDPNKYPANHSPIPQMTNHGGVVLDQMKLVTITFKDAPDAGAPADGGLDASADAATSDVGKDPFRDTLRQFGDFILTSDWWGLAVGSYGVKRGSSKLYAELPGTLAPVSLTDGQIVEMLQAQIEAGNIPAPQPQVLYAFYFPERTSITAGSLQSCVYPGFAGYHAAANLTLSAGNATVAYAVMPRCAADSQLHLLQGVTVTASHEFAEAATDPYGTVDNKGTYYMQGDDAWSPSIVSSAGGENGDLCIFAPNYDESGFAVQPVWSNNAAAASDDPCQPVANTTSIYFNAAVRTQPQSVNGHTSDGYLIIKKGTTQQAIVDVFSHAKLPHDLTIAVGQNKFVPFGNTAPIDPSDMNPIGPDVTASLDRKVAHNGNGLVLTIAVAKTTPSGDYPFVVRSVLEASDYHDWPVILHVP